MCQGLETPLTARLVDLLWPLEPVGGDGFQHSRQTRKHKSRIPCPIFAESRFPGNSQIPDPVNIFIVFPIPAPYFGQIPNPKNTLPDPDVWQESQGVLDKFSIQNLSIDLCLLNKLLQLALREVTI